MLNTLKLANRTHHPPLFSYSLPSHIITRSPSAIRSAQAASGPKQPDSSEDMNSKSEHESKTRDTMSSFGEGYSTRSDEEGFGGIYGGNQYFGKDEEEKTVDGDAAEFDQSQGSEVKEKETSRNQCQRTT